MFKSKIKMLQLAVTLSACAFLLVPTILSVMAGLTVNYFKGISSGLTLKWVYQVWELYADSIFLSMWLAIACLFCTLIIGLPAAYGLARHPGWLSRLLEEFISSAACGSGSGFRTGIVAALRFDERLSCFMDVHFGGPCALHLALYGTIDSSGSCRHGPKDA